MGMGGKGRRRVTGDPEVVRGLLGWSNKRSGLEFYRWDEKIIPRHSTEWGELLVAEPEVIDREGSTVIVAILPRSWSGSDIQAVEAAVRQAVGA
jgi:hypothetical protein